MAPAGLGAAWGGTVARRPPACRRRPGPPAAVWPLWRPTEIERERGEFGGERESVEEREIRERFREREGKLRGSEKERRGFY